MAYEEAAASPRRATPKGFAFCLGLRHASRDMREGCESAAASSAATSSAVVSTAASSAVSASVAVSRVTDSASSIAASANDALLQGLQRRLTKPGAKTPVKLELIALAVARSQNERGDRACAKACVSYV